MASDGSLDAWRRVYEIAREGLENDAYFKLQGRTPGGELDPDAEVLIDIDNLIDYNMILFYGGNLDAAITWFGGIALTTTGMACGIVPTARGFSFLSGMPNTPSSCVA